MAEVVVVGAGLGGLAAAVSLAAAGVEVTVVEASDAPGGKAGERTVDGVSFDTGPSVLTLPGLLEDLLAEAGVSLSDVLPLRQPEPAFRYRWPDGVVLDVHQQLGATEASVREALGPEAAEDFVAFMAYSKAIWEAAAPYFVLARAPSPGGMMKLGMTGLKAVTRIDPFRTMDAAIRARVRSPYLRDVFARFATYNGSDPRSAPATLNCIAHVEMGIGSYGVEGGVHRLPRVLARVARQQGVSVRLGSPVERVEVDGDGVSGVRLRGGEVLPCRRVVVNADVAHLVEDLLPPRPRHGLSAEAPRSTSGFTAVLARPRSATAMAAHTALFPTTYAHEFRDLFDRGVAPEEPTVYLCNQTVAHGREGWGEAEPVFVMANAPAEPRRGSAPETWEALEDVMMGRLEQSGLLEAGTRVVWRRSPRGLARDFPGSRGALYGAASNSPLAAFQRPPNRVRRVPGLYLASGSAHPGGGMPLCLQSGRLAADAIREDLGV